MNENNDPTEYLTVEELKEEFSTSAKRYSWTSNKLVEVWKNGGIEGKWDTTNKKYIFMRGSVIKYLININERM